MLESFKRRRIFSLLDQIGQDMILFSKAVVFELVFELIAFVVEIQTARKFDLVVGVLARIQGQCVLCALFFIARLYVDVNG